MVEFTDDEIKFYNIDDHIRVFGLNRIHFGAEMDKESLINNIETFCNEFKEYEKTYNDYLDLLRELKQN